MFSTGLVILACPICTYDRFQPTWILFAALRLAVVLAVSYRRLDPVRTLGAFTIFEVGYYYAWRLAVWYSHPAIAEGFVAWLAQGCLILLTIGLPAVCLLSGLSKVPYFRSLQSIPLTYRRALLLVPAMIGLAAAQVK